MRVASAAPLLAAGLCVLGAGCEGGPGSARIFKVDAGAMEPTLQVGERVAVTSDSSTPHVDEIVVFHPPEGSAEQRCGRQPAKGEMCSQPAARKQAGVNIVSRIVAGPGDEIYMTDGHLFRKAAGHGSFVRELDPYIRPCGQGGSSPCSFPKPITVPAGHWFMVGDNRGESDDSRFWGPVPTSWLVGQVQLF